MSDTNTIDAKSNKARALGKKEGYGDNFGNQNALTQINAAESVANAEENMLDYASNNAGKKFQRLDEKSARDYNTSMVHSPSNKDDGLVIKLDLSPEQPISKNSNHVH